MVSGFAAERERLRRRMELVESLGLSNDQLFLMSGIVRSGGVALVFDADDGMGIYVDDGGPKEDDRRAAEKISHLAATKEAVESQRLGQLESPKD